MFLCMCTYPQHTDTNIQYICITKGAVKQDQSCLDFWPGHASNKYPGLRQWFLNLKSCLDNCNVSRNTYSIQLIHHISIFQQTLNCFAQGFSLYI